MADSQGTEQISSRPWLTVNEGNALLHELLELLESLCPGNGILPDLVAVCIVLHSILPCRLLVCSCSISQSTGAGL